MCECAHASLYIWRSEDNLSRLVLSFHCGDSRNQNQVTRFGHYPQNHHSICPVTILSDDARFLSVAVLSFNIISPSVTKSV